MTVSIIDLGSRHIGFGHPAYIIAEAGVNHNGDFDRACNLVRAAAACGADCIKFQTFRAKRIVTSTSPKPPYQIINTGEAESQQAMLTRLEMPLSWYGPLMDLCRKENILFLSTPYDVADVQFLERIDIPAYKVPSALAVEPDYLKSIARTGKPVFLSTGMCTLSEVAQAIECLRAAGNDRLVVLQCTTNYPSKPQECHLRVIPAMRDAFSVLTGYSDHTEGLLASTVAMSLGACVIERHFTLDRNLPGPDHASSSEPEELAELVRMAHTIGILTGQSYKRPTQAELANRFAMRRSIVAAQDISAGTRLSRAHIACKRPANGLSPRHLPHLLGRLAACDIKADTALSFEQFLFSQKKELTCNVIGIQSYNELKSVFEVISKDEAGRCFFHPHPFTQEVAQVICNRTGKDIYVLFHLDGYPAAYGMLRGWDEGYAVPSLGFYVLPDFRGQGMGAACLPRLHALAREAGAASIRLSVDRDNIAARRLYWKQGYTISKSNGSRLVCHVYL